MPKERLVWFDTTIAEFEVQLSRLDRAGARPISLSTVENWLATGANPPFSKAIALCFDDNTEGIYRHAFPLLKKRDWPFSVSVHTAYVGVKTGKSHCTWKMLKEMEQYGATIVCQTHTHPPDLRLLSDARLAEEFSKSRHLLATQLKHDIRLLTYPSGKWDARVAKLAEKAGYLLALTEDRGTAESSPHRLGVRRYSTHRCFDEAVREIRA